MASARPLELRTSSGLYAGRAIGVEVDRTRLIKVGRKIARGVIFHDAGCYVDPTAVAAAPMSIREAAQERRDHGDEHFWIGLSSSACLHDQCDEGVAFRRFYEGIPTSEGVMIVSHMAIMLWSLLFFSSSTFALSTIRNKRFRFAINTEDGPGPANRNRIRRRLREAYAK